MREQRPVQQNRGLRQTGQDQRGRILLVYAAREPHTGVIVDALAARLRRHGFAVEIGDTSAGTMPPPQDYDVVVLGSPMVFGREARLITTYIEQNRDALAELPSALFTVSTSGAVRDHDPGGFLAAFLRAVNWQPDLAAAFAGGEPFPSEGIMLCLGKWVTNCHDARGPAASRTDWTNVRHFADAIATELAGAAVIAERTEPHVTGH